jgi:hypothetical protein
LLFRRPLAPLHLDTSFVECEDPLPLTLQSVHSFRGAVYGPAASHVPGPT